MVEDVEGGGGCASAPSSTFGKFDDICGAYRCRRKGTFISSDEYRCEEEEGDDEEEDAARKNSDRTDHTWASGTPTATLNNRWDPTSRDVGERLDDEVEATTARGGVGLLDEAEAAVLLCRGRDTPTEDSDPVTSAAGGAVAARVLICAWSATAGGTLAPPVDVVVVVVVVEKGLMSVVVVVAGTTVAPSTVCR